MSGYGATLIAEPPIGALMMAQSEDPRDGEAVGSAGSVGVSELLQLIHDLSQPLTTIRLAARLLQRSLPLLPVQPPGVDMQLDALVAAVDQVSGMAGELLQTARTRTVTAAPLRQESVELIALVRREAAQQPPADAARIEVDSPMCELIGRWDPAQIERVVANLIDNAVKYSPGGGPIRIALRTEEGREDGGAWAVLDVVDRGIGIPERDLPRVSEPFHRGRNVGALAGTGIGLTGVRRMVEAHGGTIAITSRTGAGTTVTVRLPL
jgi:signal transduction histidine kinase